MIILLRHILLFTLTIVLVPEIVGQHKSRVNIEHADSFRYNAKFGKDIQRLIGNVVIRQDSTDLLINYGNVYIAALNVLKKRERRASSPRRPPSTR